MDFVRLIRSRLMVVAATVALLAAASCGQPGGEIVQQRVTEPAPESAGAGTTAERFGFRQTAPAPAASPAYEWDAPEGWTPQPSAPLRPANFTAGETGAIECYLSVLSGGGGGIEANVNRWRAQMTLPALTSDELDALPRLEVLGAEAVLVDFEGAYTGMGEEPEIGDARMLGAILMDGPNAVFIKMTGPNEEVLAEQDNFLAFVRSLRRTAAADPHQGLFAEGDDDWVHPPIPQDSAGMGGLSFESERPTGLRWTAPEGWKQAPDRPVRLVTYTVGPADQAECYVTVLGGGAGGVDANLNRWNEQMGRPAMSAAEIAALPEIEVLGQQVKLLEATGAYTDMMGQETPDAMMYGVVCPLDGQVLFVKMTGPAAILRAERERFVQFCGSLRFAAGV